MKINAGTYNILIENGILQRSGKLIADTCAPFSVMIVSDDRVYPLYGEKLKKILAEEGFKNVYEFIFPNGERSKNMNTLSELLEALAEKKLTRTDMIIALGGGVVGDLAGFAAAVYLRGIKYVGIPTSVLASVDSSVGGKTAVDLAFGKNLAGAFHEPSLVLIDPLLHASLTPEFFSDGMAEVIKYAFINTPELISLLPAKTPDMEKIISLCVNAKVDIVSRDPFDHGERQLLNLGHTFGHAIEQLSDFRIAHGHAVASGMYLISLIAVKKKLCASDIPETIRSLLEKYSLDPDLYKRFTPKEIYSAALHDKKIRGGGVTLVMPISLGKAELIKYPASDILSMLTELTEGEQWI